MHANSQEAANAAVRFPFRFPYRVLAVCLAFLLLLLLAPHTASGNAALLAGAAPALSGFVEEIDQYGNIHTDISDAEAVGAGFAAGDLVEASVGSISLALPLVTAYSDVDAGSPLARLKENAGLILAVNMGSFAEVFGVVPGDPVAIVMLEKEGYLDEFRARELDKRRTNVREDYASDEAFANFRVVPGFDDPDGWVIYRASSPWLDELGRAGAVDALAEAAHIKTVVDLSDTPEALAAYFEAPQESGFTPSGYMQALYREGGVIALGMGVDYTSDAFAAKLAEGLRFLLNGQSPALLHCNEGKDRAGFAVMALMALKGFPAEAIVEEYALSFANYYHLSPTDDAYARIQGNAYRLLRGMAGLGEADPLDGEGLLRHAAARYLMNAGLTLDELAALGYDGG